MTVGGASARPEFAVRLLSGAVVLAAVAQVVLFLFFLFATMILHPFWDMIPWLDFYLSARARGDVTGYLWLPHNEHHFVLIRLLVALDVERFRATGVAFVIAATAAALATAAIAFVVLRRAAGTVWPLAWLAPMLLLTSAVAVDCSVPINTVYPLAIVFVVAALAMHGDCGWRRGAALLLALLASLGNAIGLLAFPALLWSAWRGGAGWRWPVTIAAIGLGYGLLYTHDLGTTAAHDPGALRSLAELGKMADYLLVYLGLPLSRAAALAVPGRLLGAGLLAWGVVELVRDALAPRPSPGLRRFAVGLIVFALAAAVLAAIGRANIDEQVKVPVRYTLLVAPLHVGLLAALLPRLAAARRRALVLAGGLGLAVVLLALQVAGGLAAIAVSHGIAATLARFDAGLREPGMEKIVYPDLAVAERVLAAVGWVRPRAPSTP